MKTHCILFIAVALLPSSLGAVEGVATEPIGFNKVTCLANSDTIVGVPLRTQGSTRSVLGAAPAVTGDSATITLADPVLSPGALTGHYLKFIDGDRAGCWYDIQTTASSGTPNTTSAVTITLNGDTIGSATTGDSVLIARYWTLDELFPPAGATTAWSGDPPVPNGHAIMASTSASLRNRRTQLLMPDLMSEGTNLSASAFYYITGGAWVGADGITPKGNTALWPDQYMTIRHPSTVPNPTYYRALGEVEVKDTAIELRTSAAGPQDNFISLMRPLNLRLDQLNLLEGGAFVSSIGTSLRNRRDQLLVFDNATAAINKSASAIYYHDGTNWINAADSSIANSSMISAASGFIIRKYSTTAPSTVFWRNPPTY